MPTDKVIVNRVDFSGMVKGDLKQWLVSATYVDGRLGMFQAHTLSPFAASLCKRAAEQGYPVLAQWRDWPGGKRLTYVELAPEDEQGAA